MEVEFGIHLDVEVFSIGKDVNAFLDLSIQTFLEGSLNFNFKATVFLNFLWMEIVKVPCKRIRCCLVLNILLVTLESVVS